MEALIFGRHVPLPACRESRFLSAKPLSFNGSREALFSSLEQTTARGEPRWGLLLPSPLFMVWSSTRDLAGGGSDWGVRLPVPLGRQRMLIRNLLCFALPRFLVCAGWGQATCASSWVERQRALSPRAWSGSGPGAPRVWLPCPLGTTPPPHLCTSYSLSSRDAQVTGTLRTRLLSGGLGDSTGRSWIFSSCHTASNGPISAQHYPRSPATVPTLCLSPRGWHVAG